MKEKFLKEIFDSVLSVLLDGITYENQKEMKDNYISYLINTYQNININEKNYNKLLPIYLKKELMILQKMSINQKKLLYLKDENMEKLIELSNLGMDLKLEAKKTGNYINDDYANECIQKMKNLINLVKPYNGELAQKYLSEGILDYEYAAGLIKFNSFRTAEYGNDNKRK